MRIPSGKTDQKIYFYAVDATDGTTAETGLTGFTVVRSRNGAADVTYTTPTIAEIDATTMPGVYALTVDEDTTIAAGSDSEEYALRITHASMKPVLRVLEFYRRDTTSGRTLSVESDGDLTKVNTLDGHTAQTGDAFARLGAPAGASVSADIAAIEAQTDDIGAAGASLTALPWNPAWDAEVQSEVADALTAYDPPTNAEMEARTLAAADYATATALATVDTVADAIQAKTDNLPSDPADQSLIIAATDAIISAVGDVPTNAELTTALDAIPTANENADALLDRADAIETGLTPRGAMRLQSAALAGKLSGAGTTSNVIRSAVADDKARITATVDNAGNRSAVTVDVN